MLNFGFDKIALIGAVALIVIGPEKLPRVARTVGALIGKAQRYVADVKAEVNRSIELEELQKMKAQFETAATDIQSSVQREVNDASQSFESSWKDATAGLEAGAMPMTPVEPLAAPPPAYKRPNKKWRLKRGAMPLWFKQRQGIRRQAQSGAARVAASGRRARGEGEAMATEDPKDELAGTEAPFVTHLVELRDRLIRALAAVVVVFIVLCVWPGPGGMYDLLSSPMTHNLPAGTKLIATNVFSPFLVPLKITLMAAFLVALPVVLYQLWAFVAPGLYSHEKKMVMPLVVSSTVLFFAGVAFCFFIVIPALTRFIVAVAPSSINTAPDIEQYFGTVLTLFMVFGVAFEVPVAVVVLARIGIVSIEQLKKFRGYFVVVAFIVSAIVTPPDVVSQLSLAIPLCVLYELGIWSARLFIRATKAPPEKEAAAAKES